MHFIDDVRDSFCGAAVGLGYVGVYDFAELGHSLWVLEEIEWKVPSGGVLVCPSIVFRLEPQCDHSRTWILVLGRCLGLGWKL